MSVICSLFFEKFNACDEARELPHLDSFARLVHFELKVINRNLSCSSFLQQSFFLNSVFKSLMSSSLQVFRSLSL